MPGVTVSFPVTPGFIKIDALRMASTATAKSALSRTLRNTRAQKKPELLPSDTERSSPLSRSGSLIGSGPMVLPPNSTRKWNVLRVGSAGSVRGLTQKAENWLWITTIKLERYAAFFACSTIQGWDPSKTTLSISRRPSSIWRKPMGFSRNKHVSKKQESRVASDIGGRTLPGSGASDFYKGDVRKKGELLVEAKTTSKESYSLKKDTIDKVRAEAAQNGEDWAMQIEFQGQQGQNRKVAVIDWYRYLELEEAAKSGGK